MNLQHLLFDASDDGEGTGTWEAMASVQPDRVPAVMAEVQMVLERLQSHSPGPQGPLDAGGVWDADTHVQQDGGWTTVTLTVVGPWDWGEALLG